jgi:hypothetical protein
MALLEVWISSSTITAGLKVLVSPQWIERVSWAESKVFVNLPRATIKSGPEYDSTALLDREYEESLYQHYGRPRYWKSEPGF